MEVWKDAVGFEGCLQVSSEGRCKSLGRYITDLYGEPRWKPETIIANDGKSRYKSVSATVNGEKKSCSLHRLVALTFIPNPDNKPVVNHIDGNTRNNAVSNLEWCTYSENTQHAVRMGLLDHSKIRRKERRKESTKDEQRKPAKDRRARKEERLEYLKQRQSELRKELRDVELEMGYVEQWLRDSRVGLVKWKD